MSKKHPKSKMSIMDFQKKFDTEDKCRDFLFELRFPHGFVCPHCGCSEYGNIKSRHLYQCKGCRKQISVTEVRLYRTRTLNLLSGCGRCTFLPMTNAAVLLCRS